MIQLRPDRPESFSAVEWLAFASNAFNMLAPFYADVEETPDYLSNTEKEVSTDNCYWTSRLIAAMADASYGKSLIHVERCQERVAAKAHELINRYDALMAEEEDGAGRMKLKHEANRAVAEMLREEMSDTLGLVLFELSGQMKNAYSRSDA